LNEPGSRISCVASFRDYIRFRRFSRVYLVFFKLVFSYFLSFFEFLFFIFYRLLSIGFASGSIRITSFKS
jgi:hypothetical protein